MERARLTTIFDQAAPLYDTREPRFFREIASRLVARLSPAPDSDVLDIATGPGVVLLEMARTTQPGGRLVGVDLSAGMVREARARLSAAGITAQVLVMAAEELAFLDESFDLVTMSRAYSAPPAPGHTGGDPQGASARRLRRNRGIRAPRSPVVLEERPLQEARTLDAR